MPRTTGGAVQGVLGDNYGGASLTPFIDTASAMVDQVVICAGKKGITLTTTTLELIERWLAAWYYTQMDPLYKSRATAGASGAFMTGDYLKAAIGLDSSGCLNALINRKTAGVTWLGKTPSEQIPIWQRD
jgi:hypothetical protein